ncbi:MAG: HAD family phosphatase [Fusobacteriaceae bacterium]|nr:HAD family phosphatase [Fusobacteriaceae bacterium]MBN2837596.1 HAD family phosphatase [Fusobacteriaceae bacterium]
MEAIVLDLDGTLLSSNETILDETRETLYKLKEKGIKIIIATGRTFTSLKPYKDMLGLATPIVCFNGAKLVDKNENTIFETPVKGEIAIECIKIAKEMGIHINFYQNEVWYVEKATPEAESYRKMSGLDYELRKIEEFKNYHMTKLLFIGEHSILCDLNEKIKEKFPIEVHRAFSKRHYLEIMDKTVNKGETLLKLFEMEGINKKNVIAFGDGWNDLEMLQLVGEGVAMGNADEELKKVVGRSCDTNDNNGISKYLAKYL